MTVRPVFVASSSRRRRVVAARLRLVDRRPLKRPRDLLVELRCGR